MPIRMPQPDAEPLAASRGTFANHGAVPDLLRQADYIRETKANSVADSCPDRIAARMTDA